MNPRTGNILANKRGFDAYGFGRVPRAGDGVGPEEVRGEVERR
jgi:hypothetical protein